MSRHLLAAAAALAIAAAPAVAQEWRGWNIHVPDYPNSKGLDRWAELVAQRTNNRIRMRMFHSAQLGQQDEAIQQLRLGAIDVANFNITPLNNLVPETQVLTLPFIFRDVGHSHRVVDGAVGDAIARAIEAKLNMVVVSWFDAGARSVYTRDRPIRTPADMRGLKIRVQTSDLFIDLMRALGANEAKVQFSPPAALELGDGIEARETTAIVMTEDPPRWQRIVMAINGPRAYALYYSGPPEGRYPDTFSAIIRSFSFVR